MMPKDHLFIYEGGRNVNVAPMIFFPLQFYKSFLQAQGQSVFIDATSLTSTLYIAHKHGEQEEKQVQHAVVAL